MSEWISVKDELPNRNTLVAWLKMCNQVRNGIQKKWISKVDDIHWADNSCGNHVKLENIDATHWMPLPEPPK